VQPRLHEESGHENRDVVHSQRQGRGGPKHSSLFPARGDSCMSGGHRRHRCHADVHGVPRQEVKQDVKVVVLDFGMREGRVVVVDGDLMWN
jgi:hypothetical protein